MARLTHPNVVTVHDVGEHEGRVYVAMELVEGQTLDRWLKAEPRSWREALEVLMAAGRGLHAAHVRELVHRDFKPDNVMISHEGHVRVMDFGLARSSGDSIDDAAEPGSLSPLGAQRRDGRTARGHPGLHGARADRDAEPEPGRRSVRVLRERLGSGGQTATLRR